MVTPELSMPNVFAGVDVGQNGASFDNVMRSFYCRYHDADRNIEATRSRYTIGV